MHYDEDNCCDADRTDHPDTVRRRAAYIESVATQAARTTDTAVPSATPVPPTAVSARSIIAEALLRQLEPDIEVESAGTQPKGINPYTALTLHESALPLAGAYSKHVDDFAGEHFDYAITVCDQAAEQCPIFPEGPGSTGHSVTGCCGRK